MCIRDRCISLSNSGGPSGNVANNAPSYNNCTQCHYGSVNSGGGSASVLGLPGGGYIPGESYILTVSVSGSNERGYGFQMASQVGNDNAGTFSLGSTSENAELNGNRVQHSTRTVSGEWIIEWLAPSSDVGDITFSVSGLATGGTSGNGGDDIYTSSTTISAAALEDITAIADIQSSSNAGSGNDCNPSDMNGQTVTVSGTITASTSNRFMLQDGDGEWDGIYVYDQTNPAVGDSVKFDAVVEEYFGLTELKDLSGFSIISQNNTVSVTSILTGDLANGCDNALAEKYEGVLVKLSNVTVTQTPNQYGEWFVDDGSGECQIDDVFGFAYNSITVGQQFESITGVVDYSYSAYGVSGRSDADFVLSSGGVSIGIPSISPNNPTSSDDVIVSVEIESGEALSSVVINYNVNLGENVSLEMANASGSLYQGTIPAQSDWAQVVYSITVTTSANESFSSSDFSYTIIGDGLPKVFFSEYAEGSSNNKYLEIYNGTDQNIDLSAYSLSTCSNGCDNSNEFDYPNNVTFDSGTNLAPDDVFIVCNGSADPTILGDCDQTFTYLSNGDDFFALTFAGATENEYTIIDVIGEFGDDPGDGWDVAGITNGTKDHTLVRKPSVTIGNNNWSESAGTSAGDSEWIVYDQNDWTNIGFHSQSVDAPIVSFNSVSPAFITSSTEIEFTALVTTPVGSITSAVVKYGTNGQLLNESELYLEGGDTWAGNIPAQDGNIVLQMQVVATNSEGTSGQSVIQEHMIANSTPNSISDLYTNQTADQIVTIKGIVTIGGSGLLHPSFTKAYVQDESGRGLQLFDYEQITDLERGSGVEAVGYAGYYYSTYQITDFEYRIISTNNTLPEAVAISATEANSSDYEGTLVTISGSVSDTTLINQTDGINLTIDDVTNVMIWSTTGVNVSNLIPGFSGSFTGVGSQFGDQYQLLVAYDSDISSTVAVDSDDIIANDFSLLPAYPNPFNPKTSIPFSLGSPSFVSIEIYNIKGKLVKSFSPRVYLAGLNQLEWDASGSSSGMYFIHLVNGSKRLTQKIMLLK